MPAPADVMPAAPGVRHTFVEAGGLRTHVAEAGEPGGSPLLLVHGWPQHWWCWRRVIPLLPRYRCLMPDLRGHGWSEAPPGGYHKPQLAHDLLELLDELGIERVCLVGHDWGAIAGFILARDEPERVSGLLAMSVPHPWPSRRDRLDPRRLAAGVYQLPLSAPLVGRRLVRDGSVVRKVFAAAARRGTLSPEEVEAYVRRVSSDEGSRATVNLYRTFLLRELPAMALRPFGRVEVPARLVVGEGDPIMRHADLEGFAGHAPLLSVERVPGARHFLPEEEPELVAARVRSLCDAATGS